MAVFSRVHFRALAMAVLVFELLTKSFSIDDVQKSLQVSLLPDGSFFNSFTSSDVSDKVTMIIMTYKRNDVLLANPIVEEIMPLEELYEVLIVWNDYRNTTAMEQLREKLSERNPKIRAKLRIRLSENNSLNNRFLTDPAIKTDAIFTIDDEWTISADSFRAGFEWWKMNRHRLVGFLPRRVDFLMPRKGKQAPVLPPPTVVKERFTAPQDSEAHIKVVYDWYGSENFENDVQTTGFNVLLPGGGLFFHRRILDLYNRPDENFVRGRNLVDGLMNCEDLMLNFITPQQFHPPILVKLKNQTRSQPYVTVHGLSTKSSHIQSREKCLRRLRGLFGNPLITSHAICYDTARDMLDVGATSS